MAHTNAHPIRKSCPSVHSLPLAGGGLGRGWESVGQNESNSQGILAICGDPPSPCPSLPGRGECLSVSSVESPKSVVPSLKDTLVSAICYLLRIPFRLTTGSASFHTPNSILIIKPCCLGDVLLATPVIAALRQAYPKARIDFAVGNWSRAMVENNPHLDELVDCGRVGSGGRYSWREYFDLVRRIRVGKYEACFVLDRSPLISLLPYLGGVPQRVGLDSRGRGFSLTVGVPVAGLKHEAELYLDTVRVVGIEVNEPREETLALAFYPTDEDRRHVAEMLALSPVEGLKAVPQAPLVVIHPAGGSNPGMILSAKRWPPQRFATLADRLIEERGAQVLLVGGPDDGPISAVIKEAMRQEPWDLTGQLTFGQLGALLEQCDLFVGHDTGAMHLAVAVSAPVVAIFGPSDPRMYGPYSERSMALWHDVGCNPCLLHGRWDATCRRFRCIEAVTVEEVWRAAAAFLIADWGGMNHPNQLECFCNLGYTTTGT
jgi:lipopolysaccharide heptosyltransferase II